MENKLDEMMQTAMDGVKRLVEVKNVIGEPISAGEGLVLVPISKLSLGFGGAGGDMPKQKTDGFTGGSAAGLKIEPIGFVEVRNGAARMININPNMQSSTDKLLDLVPQVLEKIDKLRD